MKVCSICGDPKPATEFYARSPRCKPCLSEYNRARYEADPEPAKRRAKARRDELRATNPPLPKRPKKTAEELAEIRRVAARQRYAADPDKYRVKSLVWQAAHPEGCRERTMRRKARLRAAPVVEMIDRQYIWSRDGGRCHLCGGAADPAAWHLDHLVPLSKGGEHSARNVRVSHPTCNLRRGDGRIPAQLLLVA